MLRNFTQEWGYSSTVLSDWGGTHSTAESIKAGVDIEMPYVTQTLHRDHLNMTWNRGPSVRRGRAIADALLCGQLLPGDIDTCARRVRRNCSCSNIQFAHLTQVLNLVDHARQSGISFGKTEEEPGDLHYQLLRDASASSVVLLKNDVVQSTGKKLLPIDVSSMWDDKKKDQLLVGRGKALL